MIAILNIIYIPHNNEICAITFCSLCIKSNLNAKKYLSFITYINLELGEYYAFRKKIISSH